jgi:hypothetical protein
MSLSELNAYIYSQITTYSVGGKRDLSRLKPLRDGLVIAELERQLIIEDNITAKSRTKIRERLIPRFTAGHV